MYFQFYEPSSLPTIQFQYINSNDKTKSGVINQCVLAHNGVFSYYPGSHIQRKKKNWKKLYCCHYFLCLISYLFVLKMKPSALDYRLVYSIIYASANTIGYMFILLLKKLK